MTRPMIRPVLAALVSVVLLAGCGDDDAATPDTETTTTTTTAPSSEDTSTTTEAAEPLRILLVNDDGLVNPAIDVLIGLLSSEPDVEVSVVAPADERSGSSDSLTEGGATHAPASTPAGLDAVAVDGFPADAVVVGLEDLDLDPHLVVSGINPGQNVGPLAAISGTVGAGRTAIRRGVPALAVSAGLELDEDQFAFAAGLALDWIRDHRDELVAGTHQTDTVASINVPACPVDAMGELATVQSATELPTGVNVFESSCDLAGPPPATDVDAIIAGYPSLTQVPAELPPPGGAGG